MILTRRPRKIIASFFATLLAAELLLPLAAYPLSSGPTQPEVQSFEPVGTSDMVDLFTGDFVYNIPLMDVDGYPLNISYHGGVTMEQEASWVGLGWNINPGAINRAVRGLPDDFSGEAIQKDLNIKKEITKKIGLGAGVEWGGLGVPFVDLGSSLGATLNMSNYRGISVDLISSFTGHINLGLSIGFNVGASVGSQSGAAINYGTSVGIGSSQTIGKDAALGGSFNMNYSGTYSLRTGLRREIGFNAGLSFSSSQTGRSSFSTGTSVPIGLQNYTPAVTTVATMKSFAARLKLGGELFGVYGNVNVNGSLSEITYEKDGTLPAFGYFNLEKSLDKSIMDFSREKDGMFNTTMHFLPQSTMAYDVYSVSGQGTGGSFRPFRNDYGYVHDPFVVSPLSKHESFMLEGGIGNAFELGGDASITHTKTESGAWADFKKPFMKDDTGSLYEKVYFKEAGELTVGNSSAFTQTEGFDVIGPEQVLGLPLTKGNSASARIARANLIYARTAAEAGIKGAGTQDTLLSYTSSNGFADYATTKTISKAKIPRYEAPGYNQLKRKAHHVSEIVQVQKDGRKYVYGLPVINSIQKEVTFSVPHCPAATSLVKYEKGVDDSKNNSNGLDNYYSATITPAYTSAYLLTGVLSADYIDLTGNGPTDDDLGSFTRFNYTRKNADYRWRSPIEQDSATYTRGYYSDPRDDKASYIIGSREQWMLHSIETKTSIAEFYVSERLDARGVTDRITHEPGIYHQSPFKDNLTQPGASYKLDSIRLYNKQDRLLNGNNAIPIKTVVFVYDYSLCGRLPNSAGAEDISGKLTLRKIYFKHGISGRGLLNPYKFEYSSVNPDYLYMAKDRWGGYKPNNPSHNNHEFPYTPQDSTADQYARAWSLTKITLPSGGTIEVNYESDDYAYVQDKEAMQMVKVVGFGPDSKKTTNDALYMNRKTPNIYVYFARRADREIPGQPFRDQYLKGTDILAYNIAVNLAGSVYEPIKGYAGVEEVGICSNDPAYGYIKLKPVEIEGGEGLLNPITQTALNVARYNLPHVFYPGSDPESSDLSNIVKGMKQALAELIKIYKNPIAEFLKQSRAKYADLSRSHIRLTATGLKKKGGGQRVKSILFKDNWDAMVSHGAPLSVYGKEYDYTMLSDDGKGIISSGVASWEPSIGGDDNPFRVPVYYTAQAGVNFPPNDPIDLYQELPIGESFFPAPVVGYRKVSVRSIHFEKGRSSRYVDEYNFHTARDFPVKTAFSPINMPKAQQKVDLKGVEIRQQATQGFVIVLNDMHGKPASTTRKVALPKGGFETISYQQFIYQLSSGQLDNSVDVITKGPDAMTHTNGVFGLETDVTLDSRYRLEESTTLQVAGNLNGFFATLIPALIGFGYPWEIKNASEFKCATATKIVQQYGILKEVKNNVDGTITTVINESYDKYTGTPVITSVNNEYGDREYTMNYPAYWTQKGMGPAFQNIGYTQRFDTIHATTGLITYNLMASVPKLGKKWLYIKTDSREASKFRIGDEVVIYYSHRKQLSGNDVYGDNKLLARVVDFTILRYNNVTFCAIVFQPNWPALESYWNDLDKIYNGTVRVISSGYSNQLTEVAQSVVTTDRQNFQPTVKEDFSNLISLTATRFGRKHNVYEYGPEKDDSSYSVYHTGKLSRIYKPYKSYQVVNDRNYAGTTSRNSGLFHAKSLFKAYTPADVTNWGDGYQGSGCIFGGNVSAMAKGEADSLDFDRTGGPEFWSYGVVDHKNYNGPGVCLTTKTVHRLDAEGQELEEIDAMGAPAAVIYGHNNQLPVAVGTNTYHSGFFAEGFEDLDILVPKSYPQNYYFVYPYSPIQSVFRGTISWGDYVRRSSTNANLALETNYSHTGRRSLAVNGSGPQSLTIQVAPQSYAMTNSQLDVDGFKQHYFRLAQGTEYVASVWVKKQNPGSGIVSDYGQTIPDLEVHASGSTVSFKAKTGIIEGWQQYEVTFPTLTVSSIVTLKLPAGYYYDDLRMYPINANMKSFAYNALNGKLMATLDENNYATFFEYDDEGRLIRTKKETEKGYLTISESRYGSPNTN